MSSINNRINPGNIGGPQGPGPVGGTGGTLAGLSQSLKSSQMAEPTQLDSSQEKPQSAPMTKEKAIANGVLMQQLQAAFQAHFKQNT